jgi:hypothetical protein
MPSGDVHHKASTTIYFITHYARSLNDMDREVVTFDIGLSLRPTTTVLVVGQLQGNNKCAVMAR